MKISNITFVTSDWVQIVPTRHKCDASEALWPTQEFAYGGNPARVRLEEFTHGNVADHCCYKGHVLFCLDGELETTLQDGRVFVLKPGMSYQVADGAEPDLSATKIGARLFIVD